MVWPVLGLVRQQASDLRHEFAGSEVQDEQAAVMDRLVWEPQLVDSLGSVHLKQVCYGKQAPHHCACSRHRASLSQVMTLLPIVIVRSSKF